MSLRSRMATWWRAVSRPDSLDQQVGEELEFHIESYAEDLMRGGMPRAEAMRRARAELGSVAAVRERSRQAWGTRFFDELRGDLRYALRMLGKGPGFAAIAVGSLALGIGANTAIFTVVKHVLYDRLAVRHPEQLRLLWCTVSDDVAVKNFWGYYDTDPNGVNVTTSFSYPIYRQMRRENHSLADLFAFKPLWRMNATVEGHAESVTAEMVSGNFYSQLGVKPILGRAIGESDDGAPGSGPVVVISERYWINRFAHSPDVIGKVISINLTPMTIVGVNPAGFTGAYDALVSPDVFFPFSMQPMVATSGPKSLLSDPDTWWVLMMGRAKPGVPGPVAEAALNVSFDAAIRATMPVKEGARMPRLMVRDGRRGQNQQAQMSKPAYVLQGLCGFVLLLACANLANLLLARAGARQREMSVRLALGAGQGRILRQMFAESLLLAALGGSAGLMLAWAGRTAIPRMMSDPWGELPFDPRIDWGIFAFAAAISIGTGLVFGLAPAWQASRVRIGSGLKDNTQTVTHRRKGVGGKAVVVFQISLAMLLLAGAGLFVRTLVKLKYAHLGFNPDHLVLFGIEPPAARYPALKDVVLHRELEEKLAAIPGVDSVTFSANALVGGNIAQSRFLPSAQAKAGGKDRWAQFNLVGERFFSTMGIPLVAGRGFNTGDTETSLKVAVINRELAREFFQNTDPLGQTFTTDLPDKSPITIVGICGDVKYARVTMEVGPTYYVPYRQQGSPDGGMGMTYEISTRMKPAAIVPALHAAVMTVDKNLPLLDVRTQKEQIDSTMREQQVLAELTGAFGVLALVLASIGIYGIMAYSVSRRTNEIGIRIALGAQPGQVQRMVLGEASWMVVIGVFVGMGGALALGRVIASMLYGLKGWDPATFAVSSVLLIAVALGASWIPARRAAGVDPMRALRHE
jgi:predicted permease